MTICFLNCGENLFKKFELVTFSKKDLLISKQKKAIAFDCLLVNNKQLPIERVHVCWTFALYETADHIYHSGFKDGGLSDIATQIDCISENAKKDIKIYCGWNRAVCLQRDKAFQISNTGAVETISWLSQLKGMLKEVAFLDSEDVYLTEDGDVHLVKKTFIQHLVVPVKIAQVACGKEHTLLLAVSGSIFSFGVGSRGQLGHGVIENVQEPHLIEALDGIAVKSIAAGGWHSAAITEYEDLYTWGWNESGQLGRPCMQLTEVPQNSAAEEICCLPKIVEFEVDVPVLMVDLGSRHSAALLKDNSLWTWGWNGYGQLQCDAHPCSDRPGRIELPDGFVPQKIQCSLWSTLVTLLFKNNE